MKITMRKLESLIKEAIHEAKKGKPKKDEEADQTDDPSGYTSLPVHDFSQPLGDKNRLKRQGRDPGWGPTTEQKIRTVVRRIVREAMTPPNAPDPMGPGMSAQTQMKIKRLGQKFPWFTEWLGGVGRGSLGGRDVADQLGTALEELEANGAGGIDAVDAIMVAAEMLRRQ